MFDEAAAGVAVETDVIRPRIPRAATSAVLPLVTALVRRLSPTEPSSPNAGQSHSVQRGSIRLPCAVDNTESRRGCEFGSRRGNETETHEPPPYPPPCTGDG